VGGSPFRESFIHILYRKATTMTKLGVTLAACVALVSVGTAVSLAMGGGAGGSGGFGGGWVGANNLSGYWSPWAGYGYAAEPLRVTASLGRVKSKPSGHYKVVRETKRVWVSDAR
jgi:hypothetical protein